MPNELRFVDDGVKVVSENEIMLSVFVRGEKRRYYAVNLSSVFKNKVKMTFPAGEYEVIRNTTESLSDGMVELTLNEGEGIYIKEL